MAGKEQDLSKSPKADSEPASELAPFELCLLDELRNGFKAIATEPSRSKRTQRAIQLLELVAIDTTLATLVDNPEEPDLPENKHVRLPAGELVISCHKQSQADFFVENFGAREVDLQTNEKPRRRMPFHFENEHEYIESPKKIFPSKKNR